MSRLAAAGLAVLSLAVAGCNAEPQRPAPGQAPGWPTDAPPRGAGAVPLPGTEMYLSQPEPVFTLPAAKPGRNVPYAVAAPDGSGYLAAPYAPVPVPQAKAVEEGKVTAEAEPAAPVAAPQAAVESK
ncbi:MAG: hypothetical protein HY985_07680 [Magnetospirillum sp.]|nr:hypothetical protein [Magnetospirillum sp.]